MVRTRIEPKTFFANERTFLQWLQIRWGREQGPPASSLKHTLPHLRIATMGVLPAPFADPLATHPPSRLCHPSPACSS